MVIITVVAQKSFFLFSAISPYLLTPTFFFVVRPFDVLVIVREVYKSDSESTCLESVFQLSKIISEFLVSKATVFSLIKKNLKYPW